MHVTVSLGGHLRERWPKGTREQSMALTHGSCVEDLMAQLGLAPQRVGFVLVNGRGADTSTLLCDGDRVALFPPELSFNTFVRLSFRRTG